MGYGRSEGGWGVGDGGDVMMGAAAGTGGWVGVKKQGRGQSFAGCL